MDERFVRMLREESYDTVSPKGSQEASDRKISGMANVRDNFWKGIKRSGKRRQMKPVKPTVPNGAVDPFQGTIPVGLG